MKKIIHFKKKFYDQQGQVAVIVGLLIVAFVGMTALVVDMGSLYEDRRSLQSVADAAALAGAQELPESPALAIQKATDNIAINRPDITSIDIQIGTFFVANDQITVTVNNPDSPIYFGRIYGVNSADVDATATAIVGSPSGYSVAPWGLLEGTYEFGEEYTLKYGAPPEPSPGNFGALALDGSGAPPYEEAIVFGSKTLLHIGDWIDTLTGNKAGPTRDGVNDRIAREPDGIWTNDLVSADFSLVRGDSQFIIIPIISFWPNGSSQPTQIVDFKPFIISSYSGNGGQAEVKGTFLNEALIITDGGIGGVDETGIRIIRLIK